jgi:cytochrome c-type biogenesis protein CcmH
MRNRGPHGSLLLALVFMGLGATAGCSKSDQAPRASGLAPNAAAPTVPAPAPAAPAPAVPAAAPAGPGETITGTITLAPARKADVSPSDVVYLVARRMPDSPGTRGSLVAVKRFTASSFPIEFSLGQADMMFKNGAFEGELALAARVDKDGDPITRKKGDVFGTLDRVKVGARGVEVKLTELQKEDESLAGSQPTGMPSGHP